jgi:glycosyltransferase involved in cell wall biosynthesis
MRPKFWARNGLPASDSILHFVPGDGPNALVQAISRTNEIRISILTLYSLDRTLPNYCLKNDIHHETLGFIKKQLPRQCITLIKFLRISRPKVVFAHSFYPSLLCAAVAPFFRHIKFVSVRHHNRVHIISKNMKAILLDKLIASLSFHTIAVSGAVKETMISQKAAGSKITVILNGLPNPMRLYSSKSLSKEQKVYNLIALGRIDWQKNYEGMLRCVAHTRRLGFDLRLSILGSGNESYLHSLKQLQGELGLDNVVDWLGRQADIYPHLDNADLFIHTAIDEACPLVLIETMMFGIPIYSTNLGGSRDVLSAYYLGSDPCQIESFSAGLMESLRNLENLRQYAHDIRESVISDFSDEKMQHEYTSFVKSVL